MGSRSTLKQRVLATVVALGLAAGLAVAGPPAHAEEIGEAKVWVGPGCPGAAEGWTCQSSGPVIQSSQSGRSLEVTCTLADCEIVQTNTGEGRNIASCVQDSSTNGAAQSCKVQQTNDTGANHADFRQRIALSHSNPVGVLDSVTQTATQSVEIVQTNGSGPNAIGDWQTKSSQSTAASAVSNVNLAATQAQQVTQSINTTQTSVSGHQVNYIDQDQSLTAAAGALQTTQVQNTLPLPGDRGYQDIRITMRGPGGSETHGINSANIDQTQALSQNAGGTAGLPTLLDAVQTQGQGDPATDTSTGYDASLVWDVSSKTLSNVAANQDKGWNQNADVSALGSRTQDQLDGFRILGLGLTTHLAQSAQSARLANQGDRVCAQEAELHHKITGSLTQSCNLGGEQFGQELSGSKIFANLECTSKDDVNNQGCSDEGTSTEPATETTGKQGLGQGFWKNKTAQWAGAAPGDRYDSYFTNVPANLAGRTLQEVINLGGGNPVTHDLARASVAALLNAYHSGVEYHFYSFEVIMRVNDAFADGGEAVTKLKDKLELYNSRGCDTPGCPS